MAQRKLRVIPGFRKVRLSAYTYYPAAPALAVATHSTGTAVASCNSMVRCDANKAHLMPPFRRTKGAPLG